MWMYFKYMYFNKLLLKMMTVDSALRQTLILVKTIWTMVANNKQRATTMSPCDNEWTEDNFLSPYTNYHCTERHNSQDPFAVRGRKEACKSWNPRLSGKLFNVRGFRFPSTVERGSAPPTGARPQRSYHWSIQHLHAMISLSSFSTNTFSVTSS
jgi:hypothetical protein